MPRTNGPSSVFVKDSGDNQARPTEKGSGFAQPTVDPTAFGADDSIAHAVTHEFELSAERGGVDGIEVMEANDGRLGLTGTPRVPPDDWAADSGPTKNPDGER